MESLIHFFFPVSSVNIIKSNTKIFNRPKHSPHFLSLPQSCVVAHQSPLNKDGKHEKCLSPLYMKGNTQHSLSFVLTVQSTKIKVLKHSLRRSKQKKGIQPFSSKDKPLSLCLCSVKRGREGVLVPKATTLTHHHYSPVTLLIIEKGIIKTVNLNLFLCSLLNEI